MLCVPLKIISILPRFESPFGNIDCYLYLLQYFRMTFSKMPSEMGLTPEISMTDTAAYVV
jgi:hypothetical protein